LRTGYIGPGAGASSNTGPGVFPGLSAPQSAPTRRNPGFHALPDVSLLTSLAGR